MNNERVDKALAWMKKHNITYVAIAKQIGVTPMMAREYIIRETIYPPRHEQLVKLGFPIDILPTPVLKGKKARILIFPGLINQPEQVTA